MLFEQKLQQQFLEMLAKPGQIKAMVLKGLPEEYKPFVLVVTQGEPV